MFEKAKLGIPCPACGKKTEKTVAWIKANDEFVCAGCGGNVSVDRKELLAGLKKADKAVAEFRKSLGKFGKRR